MEENIKSRRDELREAYKEWANFKKAGLSNISGADPTKEQRDNVREKLHQEQIFLEEISQAVENLSAAIENTIKEKLNNKKLS